MNYNFGNKRQWRRWLWNRINENTIDKEGIVLFLAGEFAFDISHALEKGFDISNLIAVEKDPDILKSLRQKKILAIDGDLMSVISSWPINKKVSVVIGDFCSGFIPRYNLTAGFINNIIINKSFKDTIFAFNFLRGRDAQSNYLREALLLHGYSEDLIKHRGANFFIELNNSFFRLIKNSSPCTDFTVDDLCSLAKKSNYITYTYKSSAGYQYFDSIVFKNVFSCKIESLSGHVYKDSYTSSDIQDAHQKKKTAAILACRTRLIRKSIPGLFHSNLETR